jgi:hypothetical protein
MSNPIVWFGNILSCVHIMILPKRPKKIRDLNLMISIVFQVLEMTIIIVGKIVTMPKPNTTIIWTTTYLSGVWVKRRCGSKNLHPKDMCFKEIRLHAQNMLTIMGSIVNMIRANIIYSSPTSKLLSSLCPRLY